MKVFVSSTVNDLETYREEVRRALYQAGIHCHLSEDWVHTYVDTLDIVRQRLAESDTYFGIFAHYYGSVPPKSDESITALEFRWANERPLPMAVFMPEIGGEADRELQHAAERLLKERFPDNAEQRIWYLERQRKFRELVATPTDGWRPVNHFQDRHHLGIQAAIVQGTLRHELIRASDMRPNGVLRETTEAELGSLGRREHLSLARRALDRAAQLKDVALCLNIAGPEDDGQGEFAQALAAEVLKKRCRAPSARRPPFDRYRLDDMVRWAGKVFGGSETTTLSALAALIVTKTKERPLALIVDPVDAFEGGHAGFHACFWQPLVEGLKANAPVRRPCLIVATVSYRELSDVAAMPIAPAPASPSGELALPSLGTLHEADVIGWLAEMEVPDDSGCRHVDLAAAVTRTPAGAVDGTPRRVLERLRRLDLWPAGEP